MKTIYIYKRNEEKIDEATLCFGDVLNSRGVVGPGERSVLPGHVRELGYHGGPQGVQSNIVGPFDDLPPSATT